MAWKRAIFLVITVGAVFVASLQLSSAGQGVPPSAAPPAQENTGSNPPAQSASQPAADDYVGMDTCIACHEDQGKTFRATAMGKAFAHPRTALEGRGCEACHGPGKGHVEAGGGKDTIPFRFGKDSRNTAEEQNQQCLQCHSRDRRMFWRGSPHELRAITCVDCHQGHQHANARPLTSELRYDQPLTVNTGIRKPQPELCLDCHQMRRAQLQRSSHMPYREGKVTCTSCHNPHGSPYESQLLQATVNENCYSCHAERRGPFLWEHPPVMENCANCHEPHGSNNPQLLKVRMPRVCDSCHVGTRHPSQPQVLQSIKNFNRGCTNCHSFIHGSNSPSGNFFLR